MLLRNHGRGHVRERVAAEPLLPPLEDLLLLAVGVRAIALDVAQSALDQIGDGASLRFSGRKMTPLFERVLGLGDPDLRRRLRRSNDVV